MSTEIWYTSTALLPDCSTSQLPLFLLSWISTRVILSPTTRTLPSAPRNPAGYQHQHGSQSRLNACVHCVRNELHCERASSSSKCTKCAPSGEKPGRRCQTAPRELIEIANMVFREWERMHSSDRRIFGERRKYPYTHLKEAGLASSNNVGRSNLSLAPVHGAEDTVATSSAQDESSPGKITHMEASPVSDVRSSIAAQVHPVSPKLDLITNPTWSYITQPQFDYQWESSWLPL